MDNATIDLQHQFYDMLMQSQYWSAERMRDYQRSQLTHLLRHAKKNVPFYENRLDAVLRPNGEIDWDRWGEIPIVKRSDLIEHRDAMQANELPPGHQLAGVVETSGSSGLPISISISKLMIHASDVSRWRAERWNGVDWSRRLYARAPNPAASWPNGVTQKGWGPPWAAESKDGTLFVLDMTARPEQQLEYLLRCRPDYAAVGPNPLLSLCIEIERTENPLALTLAFTTGERAPPEIKQTVSRVMGARVVELYSAKETAHTAYQCSHSGLWHINAETVFLEIVDANGNRVQDGVQGRVVVTPFFSTVQPLIRYELGDLAAIGERCSCGVHLPTLKSLDGRTTEMFSHPDGRRIQRHFPEYMREILRCTKWQFAQVGAKSFEIRYQPIDDTVGDEEAARQFFKGHYFDDCDVSCVRLPRIEPAAGGKHIEYVNEYAADHNT